MKKILVVCFALLIYQKWDDINSYINPSSEPLNVAQGEVVLYSTVWCGYCRKTRELLSKKNVPFKEYDIEKSDKARRQFVSLGGKGVPVLVVGNAVIHGYDKRKIEKALRNI